MFRSATKTAVTLAALLFAAPVQALPHHVGTLDVADTTSAYLRSQGKGETPALDLDTAPEVSATLAFRRTQMRADYAPRLTLRDVADDDRDLYTLHNAAAALRYVGPAGTPTNFLTGTVTNWVSAMVELHRPSWNTNSALRIGAMVVFAGVGAVVQTHLPAFSYLVPVLLVALAIALMARVTVLNHGGLTTGDPQFAPDEAR